MKYILLMLGLLVLVLALCRSSNARRHRRSKGIVELVTAMMYLVSVGLLLMALLTWSVPVNDGPQTTSSTTVNTQPNPETTVPSQTTEPTEVPTTEPSEAPTTEPTEVPTTEPVQLLSPGWNEVDGKTCYAGSDGTLHTGWLELDGDSYFFKEDGAMVRGEITIGGTNYHFDSSGRRIIMVNPWNPVPEDYVLDLVSLSASYATEGNKIHKECEAALKEMINACNSACPGVCVVSGYRSIEAQTRNFNRRVQSFIDQGYSQEEAWAKTAERIAVPGTSEHHLGLAADIVDTRLWALEEEQEDLPAQQWLMQNCWKYGFILRYPKDKIGITGIIYEPWHYRYVGKEVAKEIYDAGITLEEYIQNLTEK